MHKYTRKVLNPQNALPNLKIELFTETNHKEDEAEKQHHCMYN